MNIENGKIEYVKCNLCGSNNSRGVCSYGEIKIVKCKKCGLIYRNPRLKESMNREFYSYDYYGEYEGIEEKISQARMGLFKNVLSRLQRERTSGSKKLLDVGCGQGHFLKLAMDSGWQVEGVELARSACDYAKQKFDIDIKNKDLKEANFPDAHFDVVTLWNVLDHLLDPLDTLKEIHRILKTGGILVIRVPNVNFHLFIHRLFSFIKSDKLPDPSIIVNYGFSKSTIRKILEKAGFHNIKIYNSLPSYGDPYKSFKNYSPIIINSIKKIYYIVSCFGFYLSFKYLTISSSLLVYAKI